MKAFDIGELVLLAALWGASFLFMRLGAHEFGPIVLAAVRVGLASAMLIPLLASRGQLAQLRTHWKGLLIVGALNSAIPFALFPYAEEHVASSIIGVINGMTPMTTVIVSQLWPGGEKATPNKIAGVVIGLLGAVLLASPSLGAGSTEVVALLAALVATLCYALTLNYARRFKGLDSATVASSSLTGAAIVMIPIALFFSGVPVITKAETWASLFGIAVFSTSFSFLLVYWLLPRVGATNLSLNTFITPISAILLGVLVLHEGMAPIQIAGIAVIFIGLVVIDGRLLKRLRPAAA